MSSHIQREWPWNWQEVRELLRMEALTFAELYRRVCWRVERLDVRAMVFMPPNRRAAARQWMDPDARGPQHLSIEMAIAYYLGTDVGALRMLRRGPRRVMPHDEDPVRLPSKPDAESVEPCWWRCNP